MIETVGGRQPSPVFTHDVEGLRPSPMSISADHVRNDKRPVGLETALDSAEKILQLEDVMQTLIRNHGVIFVRRIPVIQIHLYKVHMGGKPVVSGGDPPSFQHCGIQIEAIEDEIGISRMLEVVA